MLIRQKAGWHLHHQAYLWPRKNRAIQLSLSSQPLPRRRQSRNIRCHARSCRPSLPSGESSSLSPYTHGVNPSVLPAHRNRKCSRGSEEVDSPLTSISLSTCTGNLIEDLSTTSSSSSKTGSLNGSSERESYLHEKTGITSTRGDLKDMMTGQRVLVQSNLKHWFTVQSRARSDTRLETKSVRTRRDTKNTDSKSFDSSSNSSSNGNLYSNPKGSSNLNNNLVHWNSNQQESVCIKDTSCLQTLATTCSSQPSTRMGVLCTEKHCHGEKCVCGGASDNSPKPATLPSFPVSLCENGESSSQDKFKNNTITRKRSLDTVFCDLDDSGTPALRRRTQRSPSIGSLNGTTSHVSIKEKLLTSEISNMLGQNGFKPEKGHNGIKFEPHNGTRPLCLGTESKAAGIAHYHHPAGAPMVNSTSTSQTSLSLSLGKDTVQSRSSNIVPSTSTVTSTGTLTTGSNACSVSDEAFCVRRPQTLIPLSSSHLPHQPHITTQGHKGSTGLDILGDETNIVVTSVCKSTPPNSTVLSLRQRSTLGSHNNTQKPSSLPASPQADSFLAVDKSKTTLSTSASSPSLSTLSTEPQSPSHSSIVQCKWHGCSYELDASDLLEHIRKHAESQIAKETYSCLWEDCKVFDKPSWSGSWLERHIVTHSGHRPFKCILDNCGQRFHSQAALERHVNGHFTANTQNGTKCNRSREEINHRMLQKRKKQLKRRSLQAVKRNDYFDEPTMTVVKQELLALAEHTQLDISGSTLLTTFQGSIVGRRETKCGSKQSLMEFIPSAVLEDEWIPEEEAQNINQISIPLPELPRDTVTNLHECLYRRHRFRKHRRK